MSKALFEELDLTIAELRKENQELKSQLAGTTHCFDEQEHRKLKKQLEEINKMIEKCGFANIEQVMLNYCGLLTQQKEFIKFLEDELLHARYYARDIAHYIEYVLRKYKEIVNGSKRN